MPNITTNHAITYTNIFLVREILPAYMKIRVNNFYWQVGYHKMSEKEPS